MLYAGTSGFAYASWKPTFYPAKLPSKRFLEHYASRLNCVEINYTFRALPKGSMLENWIRDSPNGFLFCPKAHQRITHFGRLKADSEFTQAFFRSLEPLRAAQRLGPILFQLPPSFKRDDAILSGFLAIVPNGLRCSFEFRHESWWDDAVYQLLKQHNAALCWAESEEMQVPQVLTANFAYLRLRKTDYTQDEREALLGSVRKWVKELEDVFVFFKHEDTPEGALYAEDLLKRL
jgi:uncharacterized protein YecE (DUF72 family)